MKTYRAKFSTATLQASIHAPQCSAANGSAKKDVCWNVEAASAADAAKAIYDADDFEGRGIAMPKVCKCCQ